MVFLGLCNSGKTQAWTRLLGKKHVHTVTSMKCNVGTYSTLKKVSSKEEILIYLLGHVTKYKLFDHVVNALMVKKFPWFLQKSIDLVDIPGSERIRNLNLDPYRANIRGIVFFVDSLTIQKEIRDVAE